MYPGIQDVNQKYLDALRRALEQADGLDKVFAHHITNKSGKYIVFCANKEHMDEMISHVPEWFAKVNAEVAVYEAYSDDLGTDKAFADFKADESDRLKLLFCIDMLNEGVHVEGISGVILFRPTISPIIYKQQIGRALTAGDNSAPLILDVVNNFEGLCSIAGLQGEMQEAIYRLNANGEGDKIITERFEVIEQVHDCRVLFEQLQASLSSSWDHYFSEASIYYAEHGNLNIPKRYTTPAGLSLGEWLTTQRRVRAGQIPGNLSEQQIARLDSIGMKWGNRNDAAWERGLEEARKFREQFGNLQIPAKYKTKDGYPLGKWINNARKRRNDGKLTEERIRQLDQLGMTWSVFDAKWEQGYALAAIYAQEYGNLDVPRDYKTADGKTLGRWIQNQELAYEQKKLSADQIKRLETIGMQWGSRYDRQWNEVYQAAKRYFEANGDLDVPVAYVSPEGYALGKWVRRQQYAYRNPEKSNAILSQERIELLDAVGMQWEKTDSWQYRYELAQEYKRVHGNLDIPASLAQDFRNSLAALGCDALGVGQAAQTSKSGSGNVDGVIGTQALGTNVLDASAFQNSTDRAAGDNAGTGGSGTHQNAACTIHANNLVGDGGALHGNLVHVLLGGAFTLADGLGNFAGLANAVTDVALAVANNDQGSELHNAAALNGLGNAVDGDDLGDHAVILFSVSLHGHCIFSLLTVSGRLHGHLQQVP